MRQYVTENPASLTIYSWLFKAQNLSFKKPYYETCIKCDTFEMKIKYSEGEEQLMYVQKLEKPTEKAEFAKFNYKTYNSDDQWHKVCLVKRRGKSPLPMTRIVYLSSFLDMKKNQLIEF